MENNFGLIPLSNFGLILPNVFRSAQPVYGYQFNWLKNKLDLATIINLRSEKNIDEHLAPKFGIQNVTFAVDDHKAPDLETALRYMEFIKTVQSPTLIHCEHGHGRTSTFSVLTKLAHGYTLDEAMRDEEERFGYKFKYQSQIDFLKTLQH